jgi:hypothetical protein
MLPDHVKAGATPGVQRVVVVDLDTGKAVKWVIACDAAEGTREVRGHSSRGIICDEVAQPSGDGERK